MQERTLDTWEQFTEELQRLYADHEKRKVDDAFISSLLFRGHGDSGWEIETTLERATTDKFSLLHYYRIAKRIQPKLETLTAAKWEIPTFEEYVAWTGDVRPVFPVEFPAVPYLAYLRHHGFPSPLLDWTRSPYVAAFFAFRKPAKGATHAAIYAYIEWANSHKTARGGQSEIRGIGSGYAAHRRHFMQQSEYTVCTIRDGADVFYASHQDVFDKNDDDQDLLWKFNIPIAERAKVLKHLGRMNVNAFSLFGSDDSLLEELATTAFVLGRWRDL